MTISEFRQRLYALSQSHSLTADVPLCVETADGEIHEITAVELEKSADPEYEVIVVTFNPEVADI